MLALILATALSAHAATLGQDIESAMIGAINQKCNIAQDTEFKLDSLSVKEEIVDQNVADTTYVATFTATYLGKDESTIVNDQIEVAAVKYAISNPAVPSVEVLYVVSKDKRLCD